MIMMVRHPPVTSSWIIFSCHVLLHRMILDPTCLFPVHHGMLQPSIGEMFGWMNECGWNLIRFGDGSVGRWVWILPLLCVWNLHDLPMSFDFPLSALASPEVLRHAIRLTGTSKCPMVCDRAWACLPCNGLASLPGYNISRAPLCCLGQAPGPPAAQTRIIS